MHFKRQAQIKTQSRAKVGALLFDKALNKVLVEYFNYNNIFSVENLVKLLENIKINKYAFELEKDKQPFFRPIYSLGLMKLKTLKTYIKTNLANNFIQLFKSPAKIFILFNWKPDKNFCLYVDY